MSFLPGFKTRLLVGDFHLAAYTRDVRAPWSQDMLDVTVLTDTAKQFIAGQDTSTLTVNGLYDVAAHTDLASWKGATAQPVTLAPSGLAIGSEAWLANALQQSFEVGSQVADAVQFSLGTQTDGPTDMGVSLHDLGAETADGSATSVDNGAQTTGGAVAHLHVTAFSGLSDAVVTVEDSANNSAFSTIGTFTTVAGATAERIVIAGTVRRYVRATVDVTGTGSVTYAVALARR